MDKRTLSLAICDYQQRVLCPLYDSESNVSGQAEDVFVTTERNGWKELSFSLPSVCQTEDGTEENYRLEYLKADNWHIFGVHYEDVSNAMKFGHYINIMIDE